jgi:nitroimidazol reductase NimA-like FMN-containing flavoprotein (pyridoxamine 5'-phosphate oxidase superfamily)
MTLAMSRAEREAFLAGTHVGIVSVGQEGRGPLSAPVWYHYAPGGEVRFATGPDSRKARLLRRSGRAGFCVQTETAPYLYVSVEGPTSFDELDFARDIREMALRYLGPRMGEAYLEATYPEGRTDEVLVRLRPERWWSRDFRNFAAGIRP